MPKPGNSGSGLQIINRKGTPKLYIRGTIRGVTVFESTGTHDPVLAAEYRATREAEIYRGAIHGERAAVKFSKAVVGYLTQPGRQPSKHTRMAIGRVLAELGQKINCDQIDQTEHDRVASVICKPGASATTILRAVTTPIRAVLIYAETMGWCTAPKFRKVAKSGKRTDWFRPAEAEALIAGAAAHLQPLLIFLFCTGARLGEVVALDWDDVDLQHARCTLMGYRDDGSRTKSGDDRIVDLPPRAVAALANLGHRTGRVFLHPIGNPAAKDVKFAPYPLSGTNKWGTGGNQIRRSWTTAMKNAAITRQLTPHIARHSWASWHYCVHKDLLLLRSEGGWESVDMVERYAKLVPPGYKAEIEAFWAGRRAKSVRTARRTNKVA